MRVILLHRTGRYAGLHEIVGTVDQLYEKFNVSRLPARVEDVDFGTHAGAAEFGRLTPLYVLYREVVEPPCEIDPPTTTAA